MKLSTRSRYGMRAVLELASGYGEGPMQIRQIAQQQGLSAKYLEQLIAVLKSAGLVRSVRGPKGGYMLTRPPKELKLSEIFSVLEGPLVTVDCLQYANCCEHNMDCRTQRLWSQMQNAMQSVLESMTLQDLADSGRRKDGKCVTNLI